MQCCNAIIRTFLHFGKCFYCIVILRLILLKYFTTWLLTELATNSFLHFAGQLSMGYAEAFFTVR